MINFKNKDEAGPSALIVLAILILIVSLVFMIFVPAPTLGNLTKGHERSRKQIVDEIVAADARTKEATLAAQPRLWKGDTEAITASVLTQLTQQAIAKNLKLNAFRPQKPQLLAGVTELPYSVQISGSYPQVQLFLASLDKPGTRLVLRSIQLAAADGATDTVAATLGISAYFVPEVVASTEEAKRGK